MLSYYVSQSEGFTVRTEQTSSGDMILSLENMYTLATSSEALTYTFTPYENILAFTSSLILSGSAGDEYRATISDDSGSIWRGTIQEFQSQSVDKPNPKTQIQETSSLSNNEYIIL